MIFVYKYHLSQAILSNRLSRIELPLKITIGQRWQIASSKSLQACLEKTSQTTRRNLRLDASLFPVTVSAGRQGWRQVVGCDGASEKFSAINLKN